VTAFKRDANSPLKLGVCRADLDDERVTILLWVVVVYGCPAHPNLGKEHGEHRSRPLVSEAAVASEDRRDNAIAVFSSCLSRSNPNYGALTFTPAGLSPAEHASLTWTHLRTKNWQ
jgi:hypothetical protein